METDRIFPADWKEIIQGKKVIFYNTGVTSLLRGQEKRIEKMKWVFDVFKKYPEVVLWWRPHPLEISTIQSMIPDLEEQYMEVRRRFKEESIGILDESADLNRAIAVSDAYYGAWSSIVELYKATKKPVLYENNRVKRVEDTSFLPAALCIKDGFIWFIQLNSNKLVKMDMNTFEVEKIISIPFEPPFKRRSCNYHIIETGNSLLLLMEECRRIYEYEIKTETIRIHKIEREKFKFHSKAVLEKNNKLFLFPYDDSNIMKYDYHTDMALEKKFTGKKIKAAKCYETIGTKIYLVDRDSNVLALYDTSTDSLTAKSVGKKDNRYWGIKKAGNYFVMPHVEKQAITLWNEENENVLELTEFPENYNCLKNYAYFDMFEKNGSVYIFPYYANMVLKVDTENKTVTQVFNDVYFPVDYNVNSENFSGETYLCVKRYNDWVYAYGLYWKVWHLFDLNSMHMRKGSVFEIKKAEHRRLIEQVLDNEMIEDSFCEGESAIICNLENYIKNLQNYEKNYIRRELRGDCTGAQIYRSLIEEL